jgi:hypothetical protein
MICSYAILGDDVELSLLTRQQSMRVGHVDRLGGLFLFARAENRLGGPHGQAKLCVRVQVLARLEGMVLVAYGPLIAATVRVSSEHVGRLARQHRNAQLNHPLAENQLVQAESGHSVRVPASVLDLERIMQGVFGGGQAHVADGLVELGVLAEQAGPRRLVHKVTPLAVVHLDAEGLVEVLSECGLVERARQEHVHVVEVEIPIVRQLQARVYRLVEELVRTVDLFAFLANISSYLA